MRSFVTSCYDWCSRTSAGKILKGAGLRSCATWRVCNWTECLVFRKKKNGEKQNGNNFPSSETFQNICPARESESAAQIAFGPGGGSLPPGTHTALVSTSGKVTEITQDLTGKQTVDGGWSYVSAKLWLPGFTGLFFFFFWNPAVMTHLLLNNKVSNLERLCTRPSGHEAAGKAKLKYPNSIMVINST